MLGHRIPGCARASGSCTITVYPVSNLDPPIREHRRREAEKQPLAE